MHIVRAYVRPGDIVIDATCGGGRDTLRLAQMQPGRLFAFDLQRQAVERTRDLLAKAGFACGDEPEDTIVLTCLGHEHMKEYFRDLQPDVTSAEDGDPACGECGFASAIVFNLGYLPGGDKSCTTLTETTLAAVRDSLDLLKTDGLLCLTMYSGHPEGAAEKQALLEFASGLDAQRWHTSYISMPNQMHDPPEILLICRKK